MYVIRRVMPVRMTGTLFIRQSIVMGMIRVVVLTRQHGMTFNVTGTENGKIMRQGVTEGCQQQRVYHHAQKHVTEIPVLAAVHHNERLIPRSLKKRPEAPFRRFRGSFTPAS